MQDQLDVTLNETDFIEAYRPAPPSRQLALLRLFLIFALLTTLALLALLLVEDPAARAILKMSTLLIGATGAFLVDATLIFALLMAAPRLRRLAARRIIVENPGMRDPIAYLFDAQHFMVRTKYTQARFPWDQLWDWRETDRAIIVLQSSRNFYVVPKRGVDSEVLARLRVYLSQTRNRRAVPSRAGRPARQASSHRRRARSSER